MGDWVSADEVRLGFALDSWRPTLGTRNTGRRNTARRLVIEDGNLVPLAQPAPQTFWDFPEPFGHQDVTEVPLSEVPVIARHLRVASLRTYLNNAPLFDLSNSTTPPPTAGDERKRSAQTFLVDVVSETETASVGLLLEDVTSMPSPPHSLSKLSSGFLTDGFTAAVL